MQWINAPVDVKTLPAVEAVELQGVQGAYKKVLRLSWMITSLVLIAITAALLYFIPALWESWGWIALCSAFALISAVQRFFLEKSFPYLAYAVREHDVLLQRGWITRRLRACPFRRIQNCSVQSGPLERVYGLSTLIIYTAGSDGADLHIPGLEDEEADRLRSFILSKIHKEGDENTGLE